MDTSIATISLIKDLYASEKGLLPYTLYRKYGILPRTLVEIIKNLQRQGLAIVEDSGKLRLTKNGKKYGEGLMHHAAKDNRHNQKKLVYFQSISKDRMGRQLPYLPNLTTIIKIGEEQDG